MIKEVNPLASASSKCASSSCFRHWRAWDLLGFALMFSAAIWAIYVHCSVPVLPFDDGYITFRYVDNVLCGRGLVYNQGQNVFGSTTPLYIFLLIAAKWFSHQPIPDLAVRLNVIPFLLCGVGIFCLVRHQTSSTLYGGLGAAAFLVSLDMLTVSGGGMETFVFLAFVLFAFLTLETRPPNAVWVGILSSLAILTRPEGILLIPICAFIFRRSRRELLKFTASILLLLAPWIIFATIKFGNPIPMSLIAKSRGVYPLAPGDALVMILSKVAGWAQVETPITYYAIFGKLNHLFAPRMMLLILLLMVGSFACIRYASASGENAWVPSIYLVLLLIMYGYGNPFIFDWYMPPVYLCILLSLLIGLPLAGRWLGEWTSMNEKAFTPAFWWRATTVVAVICIFVPLFNRYRVTAWGWRAPVDIVANDPERLRVRAYRETSEALNSICSPNSVIAAPEIGALGYYSEARIMDTCGLISPEVHKYLPVPMEQRLGPNWGVVGVEMVRDLAPDYVVSMPVFFKRSLAKSEWFEEHYTIIRTDQLPKECWGSKEIVVFAKKSIR